MRNLGIYARVSSLVQGKEDRYSLPDQLDQCRIFARQRGMEVVFETTEKHSGATLHRPKIEALFERALAGEFEAIIVHEQDRLSRNPKDAAYLEVHARLHGIHLYCLDALYENGEISEIDEAKSDLDRLFSKWERSKIYKRTSERRKRRARDGKLNPSNSPLYGYRWNDDRPHAKTAYVEDPQAAPVVRRIFEAVAAGQSLLPLARQLTAEKILPPAAYHASVGQYPASRPLAFHWRPTTIAAMLRHPAYWGEPVAFRRVTWKEEVHTNGKVRELLHSGWRKTTEEGLIPLPQGACPPLVSKELADAAHQQLAANKRRAAKNGTVARVSLLRGGIAVCGYCGDKLYCIAQLPPKQPRYYCRRSRLKYQGPQRPCEGGPFPCLRK